jgi:hypothetical protein
MRRFADWFRNSVLVLTLSAAPTVMAGPYWASGTIVDYTSVTGGLLIRLTNGAVPDACVSGSSHGWMFVAETNKAMTATVLLMVATGKLDATVYGSTVVNGYCQVTQVDPVQT